MTRLSNARTAGECCAITAAKAKAVGPVALPGAADAEFCKTASVNAEIISFFISAASFGLSASAIRACGGVTSENGNARRDVQPRLDAGVWLSAAQMSNPAQTRNALTQPPSKVRLVPRAILVICTSSEVLLEAGYRSSPRRHRG
jgi:hypothetical protein